MPRTKQPRAPRDKKPYDDDNGEIENDINFTLPPAIDISMYTPEDFVFVVPANRVLPEDFTSDIEPKRKGITKELSKKKLNGVRVFCPTCGDGWADNWREPWKNNVWYCNKHGQEINKTMKGLLAMRVKIPIRRNVPACVPARLKEAAALYKGLSVKDCRRISQGLEPLDPPSSWKGGYGVATQAQPSEAAERAHAESSRAASPRKPKRKAQPKIKIKIKLVSASASASASASSSKPATAAPSAPAPIPAPAPAPASTPTCTPPRLATLIEKVQTSHPAADTKVCAGFAYFLAVAEAAQVVGVSLVA